MPGPRIDREEDTRQRLLEAMSLPDLDERARAGMNQEQSDQFIGFDKLLSNVPVQGQAPRAPQKAPQQDPSDYVMRLKMAQQKNQNAERQKRLEQSFLIGGPLDNPNVEWQGNENQGPLSAMKAFGRVPKLPDGRYLQGVNQQGLQPGDLEYLRAVIERYR